MKSKLFVEAAESISKETDSFSCNAIGFANGFSVRNERTYVDCDEIKFYSNLFGIVYNNTFGNMTGRLFGCRSNQTELKEIRILALLLAAEVVKSEKKSFKNSKFGEKFRQ